MRLTVEGPDARLDKYLTGRFPKLSRALVMKYLKEGRARINGRRARPGLHVAAGDELDLPDWEEAVARIRTGRAAGVPEVVRRPPEGIFVLYEDEDMVVVDKPAGLVMHPGKGHEEEGLDRILREHFGPAMRLVHRIDRDTSGVVVAARGHPKAAQRLADAFRAGDVEKVYLALVSGVPEPMIHLDLPAELAMTDPRRAQVLLRCAQEMITNSVRHARAKNLWISLTQDAEGEVLTARDDGRGVNNVETGNGLNGMAERLRQLGGELKIESSPGAGFSLRAWIPVEGMA